jgi:hypothetical protein
MKKSDILLLVGDTAPGSGSYIPGKLFEYMAINKPILALSLLGESTNIIDKYHLGQVVNPASLEETKAGVLALYDQWKTQKEMDPNNAHRPSTDLYERKTQAGMLAKLLEQITT